MLGATVSPSVQQKRPRLPLIALAVFWILVGGNLTGVGLNAPATVLLFFAVMFVLPCAMAYGPGRDKQHLEQLNPKRARIPLPLSGFVLWASLSAVGQQTEAGAQNALTYVSFVALMALSATWTSVTSPLTLLRWMRAAAAVGAVGYLVTVVVRGPGSDGFYAARIYGEIVWIGMAIAVPLATRSRFGPVIPLLLLAASLLSLSRTASVVCALQFIALAARGCGLKDLRRAALLALVTAFGVFLTFTQFTPMRNRFINNDNEQIGGLVTGTSGRSRIWSITWESIRESPWFGHGIGSVQQVLTDTLGSNSVSHPHNDYLRLWHDLGVIGLVLWSLGVFLLGWGVFRRWRAARNDDDRAVHLAALLCLIGLSCSEVTSNPLVYIFVMGPVAVIVGTSMGRANPIDPSISHNTFSSAVQKRM